MFSEVVSDLYSWGEFGRRFFLLSFLVVMEADGLFFFCFLFVWWT